MNARLTVATAKRVLLQLRADKRTIAMMLVLPLVLLTLLWWLFGDTIDPTTQAPMFDPLGARLMGLFPMLLMFIITSVATLRERTSGTMERLMASPMRRGDVVLGYALAFGLVAVVQGTLLVLYSVYVLSLDVAGPVWALVLIIVLDALLGTALGLAASSLARTEFQAVQMMPVVLLPQLLIAGLFMAREDMPTVLYWISTVLPLSYAIDAINDILANDASAIWPEVLILLGFIAGSLILGVTTLRRRTA
ncbi:ABC transporter permease [Demequina capsici]|uniref:Transport permease protein n=1 Tax=Demequina capsici TaxID=3075620 RepID=A0AA96FAF5_9MICO|nr:MULTISPECIES: ABC transporter permease [unclassified Demequina]WNM24304.1 ABC transporter permease [Demequina sp. OYTSA14]WNM27126.1 ABC transporter permease [Demequina sp. PMTSA13]